jgi:hypothetical protein
LSVGFWQVGLRVGFVVFGQVGLRVGFGPVGLRVGFGQVGLLVGFGHVGLCVGFIVVVGEELSHTLVTDDGGALAADDGGALAADDGDALAADDGGALAADDGSSLNFDDGDAVGAASALSLFPVLVRGCLPRRRYTDFLIYRKQHRLDSKLRFTDLGNPRCKRIDKLKISLQKS